MDTLRPKSHVLTVVVLCALGTVPLGCKNPDSYLSRLDDAVVKPWVGTPHEDVGSTHLAVLSVMRWDDYKKQLQPTFQLTEKDALKLAVADTLQTDQSLLDAFAAQLGLKLAPSDVLPAGYKKDDYAGADIPKPDASGARAGKVADMEPNDIGVDPHLAYLAATALYQEVKLLNHYIAEAAIGGGYKAYIVRTQIACMPRKRGLAYDTYVDLGFFLDDIRVPGPVARAELLSIQKDFGQEIAKIPTLANERPPQEILGLLGFSDPNRATADPNMKPVINAGVDYATTLQRYEKSRTQTPLQATANAIGELRAVRDDLKTFVKDANATTGRVPTDKTAVKETEELLRRINGNIGKLETQYVTIRGRPRVIPLLVTDQVEAALMSRRAETLRQITLALSAAYAGIGGKANVDKLTSLIESSLGRNYNSLLTVGQLSDNMLRVRFGARQSPGSHSYEMVPQTHNVTFLLLLPNPSVESEEQLVYIGSKTRFIYCRNGKPVPPPDAGLDETVKKRLFDGWKAAAANDDEKNYLDKVRKGDAQSIWGKLMADAANDDYKSFVTSLLTEDVNNPGLANRMWFDLCASLSSEYDKTTFTVPKYPTPVARIVTGESQTVILVDDGKTTSGTIIGVKDIDLEKVSAVWHVEDGNATSYEFPATQAALAQGDRDLVLTFLSLAALNLKPKDTESWRLFLSYAKPNGEYDRIGDEKGLSGRYLKARAAKEQAQIIVEVAQEQLQTNATVNGNEVTRSLRVGFVAGQGVSDKDIARYSMVVSGAVVASYDPTSGIIAEVSKGGQVYRIEKAGWVTLQLKELVAGQAVKLTFTAPAGYENPPTKEIKVMAASGKG